VPTSCHSEPQKPELPKGLSAATLELADELLSPDLIFALALLDGKNSAAAYREAHPECAMSTSFVQGCRRSKEPNVARFVKSARDDMANNQFLSVLEKRLMLRMLLDLPKEAYFNAETGQLNPDYSHLVHEYTVTRRTVAGREDPIEIEVSKIKTMSVKEILELDSRLAGHFLDPKEKDDPANGLDLEEMLANPVLIRALKNNPKFMAALAAEGS